MAKRELYDMDQQRLAVNAGLLSKLKRNKLAMGMIQDRLKE